MTKLLIHILQNSGRLEIETRYQALKKADNILLRALALPALFCTLIPGGGKKYGELFDLSKQLS